MAKPKKLTFDKIYEDFKLRHPHLSKEVVHWRPCDYMQIEIYMRDGMILKYDYGDHKAVIRSVNWKRDHISIG